MLAVLQEGNNKSPRTAAHICKSISEILGISLDALKCFKTLKLATKIEWLTEKCKNLPISKNDVMLLLVLNEYDEVLCEQR